MSKEYDCPAVFPISIILAVFTFSVCWIVADIGDPEWIFGVNMLSDMGASSVDVTRFLFNFSCIVCGLILMAFGMSKVMCRVGFEVYSGFFLTPAGFFLAMVGVFPSNYVSWLHLTVAYCFGICALLSVLISLSDCWKRQRMISFGFGIALLAVGLATAASGSSALVETWLVIMFLVWILIDSARVVIDDYFRKGKRTA